MSKKSDEPDYGVLLDTSFMIRLMDSTQPLHGNALGYFRYFLEKGITMYFSTISVAEFCTKGDFNDLPFKNIRILPFNIFHAKEAGIFANRLFEAKNKDEVKIDNRLIIPNDTKLFAQASNEKNIRYFVTSDVKSKRMIEILRDDCEASFEHLDINTPYENWKGVINFDS